MFHYTYRISNIKQNKHYYGSRTSKCDPKDDLGIKYFSSSKDKEFTKDQKKNPHNYKYKIIRTFNTRKEAIQLEIKLHNKFDVGINKSLQIDPEFLDYYLKLGYKTGRIYKRKPKDPAPMDIA